MAQIPDGKSCKNCSHFPRCQTLICSLTGDEVMCDFAPAMYHELNACPDCGLPRANEVGGNCSVCKWGDEK
jgi:hypothetical protein